MIAFVMDPIGNSPPSSPRQPISPVQSPDPVTDAAAANGGDQLSFDNKLMALCSTYKVSLDLTRVAIKLEEKTPCWSPSPKKMWSESPIKLATNVLLALEEIEEPNKSTYMQLISERYDDFKADAAAALESAQKEQLLAPS